MGVNTIKPGEIKNYDHASSDGTKIRECAKAIREIFDAIEKEANALFKEHWVSSGSEDAHTEYNNISAQYDGFVAKMEEMDDLIQKTVANYKASDAKASKQIPS